jgi:carbon storage regulator CsrA
MKAGEFGFFKKGYLILKRKAGQGFHIDSETEVVIARVEGGDVFVAIKAPKKHVVRNEIMSNEPRRPDETIS